LQAIIGGVASSETLAVAPFANSFRVVLISPFSTAPSVSDAGDYVFRVIGSDNLQGDAIAQLAMAKNFSKAATLVENNDYGIGLENVFKAKFKGTVLSSIKFGKDPGIYSDTEFDATMLAAEAIREAGNDGEKIKNALPGVSRRYKAVTGDKAFDENGDVPQDYTVLEVKNKTMVTIGNWSLGSGIKFQ
jgi:ABC-type branched-subunit amino acid transport system substrate-binding protein